MILHPPNIQDCGFTIMNRNRNFYLGESVLEDLTLLGKLVDVSDSIVNFNSFGITNNSIMIIDVDLMTPEVDKDTVELNYRKREFGCS